jgi:hypothetical protein
MYEMSPDGENLVCSALAGKVRINEDTDAGTVSEICAPEPLEMQLRMH